MILPAKNALKQSVLIASQIMDFKQEPLMIKQNVPLVLQIALDVMNLQPVFNAKLVGI